MPQSWQSARGQQIGFLGEVARTITDVERVESFLKINSSFIKNQFVEGDFLVCTQPYVSLSGTPWRTHAAPFCLISKDGDPKGLMVALNESNNDVLRISDNEMQDTFTMEIMNIAVKTFAFANCSNVKLEDVTEQIQPPAKIMRRLKLPCVKRYTLNIAGHVAPVRRDASEPAREGIMPFHLCRGHFATYTAEKPLFGKHVGRFWIPPHTKGREERGKIEKDYAIA